MNDKALRVLRNLALAVALCLVTLWGLSGIFRTGQPNAELARTTREAIRMVRRWERERRRSEGLSSAFRMVALTVGIAAPLVTVYLIFRRRSDSELDPEEILEVLQREGLIDLDEKKSLPHPAHHLLEESEDDGGAEAGE
ncbi:MAG: hypothetical protein ACOC7S_00675 [Planctomycetota bacterium]